MTTVVRILTADDVGTDAELMSYIRAHMQIANRLGFEYAVMGAMIRAMLKDADRKAGLNRRGKVARPFSMAAATMMLLARQLALADRRFRELYAAETQRTRRANSHRRRTMTFE